jgi:glycosyltransferase involved in cell wall biosynthesis
MQEIPGGIGRVTEMLCDELPNHADVVAFAAGLRRERLALAARLNPNAEFRGVGWASARWHYELWQRYRKHRVELHVDVCHAPSLAVPPTTAPLVVTINDVAFLRHPHAFPRHGLRFHQHGLAIARREATIVLAPSAFTRDELITAGFEPDRIHHVPLAVRTPEPPSRSSGWQLRKLRATVPYLLVVGTIEPRKDHRTIITAFEHVRAHCPELSLVIAGPRGWLPCESTSTSVPTGVVVLGRVSDEDLDDLYRNAELVISASIYEGFGLTVLEALARGRPVIATNIPPHVELVGDAALLFAPRDVAALAAHIDRLLRDPTARNDYGRAALAQATRFSLANTIEGHLSAYERAAHQPRRF